MDKLFNLEKGVEQGLLTAPLWGYVKEGLTKDLNQVISFYRRFPTAVNGSHFLVKLLIGLGTHKDLDIEKFFQTIRQRSMGVASSLQMSTSLNRGVVFDGIFYGKGSKEIIIGHNENFDLLDARDNWRDLEPIKILSHPKSDLNMNPIDGNSYNSENGISVISINMPMLALQYREFRILEDRIAEENAESPRSMEQFIAAYPLNNALRSHLDHCLFNRIYNLLTNKPLGDSRKKHSFYITDFSSKLNEIHTTNLLNLVNSGRKFDSILKMIPLISSDNLKQLSELPECAPTRQVVWGMVLSRLKMLEFLYKSYQFTSPRVVNNNDVNSIRKTLILLQTDKALRASLPVGDYFDSSKIIDYLLKI